MCLELNRKPDHPGLSEYGCSKQAPLDPSAPSAYTLNDLTFRRQFLFFLFKKIIKISFCIAQHDIQSHFQFTVFLKFLSMSTVFEI